MTGQNCAAAINQSFAWRHELWVGTLLNKHPHTAVARRRGRVKATGTDLFWWMTKRLNQASGSGRGRTQDTFWSRKAWWRRSSCTLPSPYRASRVRPCICAAKASQPGRASEWASKRRREGEQSKQS